MKQVLMQENLEEFNQILKKMPYFSDNLCKIPYTYQQFPKNLMDEAIKVNEKFLNRYQSFLEDRLPLHWKKLFSAYQNRYFTENPLSTNKKERLFESCNCPTKMQIEKIIRQSMLDGFKGWGINPITLLPNNTRFFFNFSSLTTFSNPNRATVCTAGAELNTITDTQNTSSPTGYIQGSKVTGTVGECYDRIALNVNSAAGNYRLASYDESAGAPNNLDAEVGDTAVPSGFTYQSVTEWSLVTAGNWLMYQNNNGALSVRTTTGAGLRLKAQAYGAFPNPIGTTNTDNTPRHLKIGHT